MTQTYLFTSPMARKKRNECHFDPNTYRVIGHSAEDIPSSRFRQTSVPTMPSYNAIGQPIAPRPESEHRHHRPNPSNVNFLRHDVRLLNEPVCNVNTKGTAAEQHQWWPHQTSTAELKTPGRPDDTIIRQDYQYRGADVKASGRFGSNVRQTVARGIVPVNFMRDPDNKQRFWQEGISYEHQFNSRIDPQYPVRAKRHGAFVWDQIPPAQAEKLVQHHRQLLPELQQNAKQADSAQQVSGVKQQDSVKQQSVKQEASKQQQQHSSGETTVGESTCTLPAVAV